MIKYSCTLTFQEISPEGDDLSFCFRVIEHREIPICFQATFIGNGKESRFDFAGVRDEKPWKGQNSGEWIDIICNDMSPEQPCFKGGRSSSGKGIIHTLSGFCQEIDEKPGKLGFEAGPVGDLVDLCSLSLSRSPILVRIPDSFGSGNCDRIQKGCSLTERSLAG